MKKFVITSGQQFTDIDALACAVAYTELLRLKKEDTVAVFPGVLNKTVTEKIKKWQLNFETSIDTNNAHFVLVDISDPKEFASFVKEENILKLFDHRFGFEDYWQEKIGKSAQIEMVGACATLIWEEFKKARIDNNISTISANLLYTAIASNTLNFQAGVTTDRDKSAFNDLKQYTDLPDDWIKTYFTDQDEETEKDIKSAILNDTKNTKPIIAQLELWDSKKIFDKHLEEIVKIMETYNTPDWYLTSPSISEGRNYLITKNEDVKKLLERTIDATFNGNVGITNKLWLRKEIIKKMN